MSIPLSHSKVISSFVFLHNFAAFPKSYQQCISSISWGNRPCRFSRNEIQIELWYFVGHWLHNLSSYELVYAKVLYRATSHRCDVASWAGLNLVPASRVHCSMLDWCPYWNVIIQLQRITMMLCAPASLLMNSEMFSHNFHCF